jgi:hypothetical protein
MSAQTAHSRTCRQASQSHTAKTDTLEPVADRGYFSGEEIVACNQAGISVTMPKPMKSSAKFDRWSIPYASLPLTVRSGVGELDATCARSAGELTLSIVKICKRRTRCLNIKGTSHAPTKL